MIECSRIHETIWEELYGLLDADEIRALNEHLAECMECREVRADMEAQQQILAGAALVVRDVPEFHPPEETPVAERPVASSERSVEEQPAAASQTPKRTSRSMRWLASALAVLLILTGSGYAWYRYELKGHRAAVADARTELQTVEANFAQLQSRLKEQLVQPPAELRAKHPQLVVTAPKHFHRMADNTFRIKTHDFAGTPVATQVVAKVVEKKSGRVVYRNAFDCPGTTDCALPSTMQCKELLGELVVEARRPDAKEQPFGRVQQPIHLAKRFASHVTVNKDAFHGEDVVFFRTLTLDQLSLQPPKKQLALSYELQNKSGKIIKQLSGATKTNGIAGGMFAVTDDISDGDYKLVVKGDPTITQKAQPIAVRRNQPAAVYVSGEQIQPGKNFVAAFRSRRKDGALVPHQPLTVMLRDAAGAPTGRPLQICTDANGWAVAKLALPKRYGSNNAQLEIDVVGESKKATILKTVPVANKEFRVEFFPEGGRLVAGAPNRVYFQVCTKDGAPTRPDGHVILLSSDDVLLDTPRGTGRGVFTMTPKRNEPYVARVTSNGRVEEIADPFADHPIQANGVVISVPKPVGRQGEPVRVLVHNSGSEKDFLLTATCRDYLVGHHAFTLDQGRKEISLPLAKSVKGFVRLTLFEDQMESVQPVAERLLFRRSAESLSVSMTNVANVNTPRQPVQLRLEASGERGAHSPVWFSALVVDEMALQPSDGLQHSALQEAFRGDAGDGIAALTEMAKMDSTHDQQALDLMLGIQGWRRFATVDAGAVEHADGVVIGNTITVGRSASVATLKNKVRQEVQQAAEKQRAQLEDDRADALYHMESAESALVWWEDAPRRVTRLVFGGAAVLLLVLACVFLLTGLWSLLRRQGETRPRLIVSLASLVGCFLLYAAFGGRQADRSDVAPIVQQVKHWPAFERLSADPANRKDLQRLTVARQFPGPKIAQAAFFETDASVAAVQVTRGRPTTTGADASSAPADYYYTTGALQNPTWRSPQWLKRYASAKMAQDLYTRSVRTTQAPTPAPMANGGAPGPSATWFNYGYFEQTLSAPYFHQAPKNGLDFQDTVCWHPGIAAPNGRAEISFDLSSRPTTYRVILFAHDAEGRMGVRESRLVVRPNR